MNTKTKMMKWVVALTLGIVAASTAGATGVLGTPVDGTVVSGVGVISGYHCTSKNIEVFIDGVSYGKAGAGTQLLGTQDVCGRTDTGFSLLYNFNNLADGQHTFSVYADGVIFDTHIATTFRSGGKPWLSGQNASSTILDFPVVGQTATLQWMQSYQNFLITSISGTPISDPVLAKTEMLRGQWTFAYKIISTFTNTYKLNNITGDKTDTGGYFIYGTDQYGDSVLAGYDPTSGRWALLDEGSSIDHFFTFYTDGSSILPNSCYFLVTKSTGSLSKCYPLTGTKWMGATIVSAGDAPRTALSDRSAQTTVMQTQEDLQLIQASDHSSEFNAEIFEQYWTLRQQFPRSQVQ